MPLRFLTAGESHGPSLSGILEGFPSGVSLTSTYINVQLQRRQQGHGRGERQKIEADAVEIVGGVRHGLTLGSPISLIISNRDFTAWRETMNAAPGQDDGKRAVQVPRPGLADLVGGIKFGHDDMRNVLERSSARETAMRVAIGAVARRLLEDLGITVISHVVAIGGIKREDSLTIPFGKIAAQADASRVRCVCDKTSARMVQEIDAASARGDTLGGVFEVLALGLPLGLGSYVHWDKRLGAEIGRAFLGLNAIKGVEIGLGFAAADLPGSQVHDGIIPIPGVKRARPATNRSGGIDGGMTTGAPIVVRAAMKPIATMTKPLPSVNLTTGEVGPAHVERSDVCAVPAASVIGEALLALVLVNAILDKFGGDTLDELQARVDDWRRHTE